MKFAASLAQNIVMKTLREIKWRTEFLKILNKLGHRFSAILKAITIESEDYIQVCATKAR